MNSRSFRFAARAVLVLVYGMTPLLAAPATYTPKVPQGYTSQVVLHVDYGNTSDKIRIQLGVDEVHYEQASVSGMRVIGDRFYFINDVSKTIKQYRSPGVLVWETERLDNLHYFAVAPDGKVYAAWGTVVDRLSCLDNQSKLLWTKEYTDILTREERKNLMAKCELQEGLDHFGWLNWTAQGLATTLRGLDENGKHKNVAVLIDKDGKMTGVLPALAAGAEGKQADPSGGFFTRGESSLPTRVALTSSITSGVEDILKRFDLAGNLTEEWRFSRSPFASRYPEVVIGPDSNVYHLRFGDTGIDVVKYSRQVK